MIQCSVCGTLIRHEWNGTYDKEMGAFICSGCYDAELHSDPGKADWLLDSGPEPVVRCPWCGAQALESDIEKPNCYCDHRPILPSRGAVQ